MNWNALKTANAIKPVEIQYHNQMYFNKNSRKNKITGLIWSSEFQTAEQIYHFFYFLVFPTNKSRLLFDRFTRAKLKRKCRNEMKVQRPWTSNDLMCSLNWIMIYVYNCLNYSPLDQLFVDIYAQIDPYITHRYEIFKCKKFA